MISISCGRQGESSSDTTSDTSFTDESPINERIGIYGPGSESQVKYMPVSKNDPEYNMRHPYRGKALIFNFDKWVSI